MLLSRKIQPYVGYTVSQLILILPCKRWIIRLSLKHPCEEIGSLQRKGIECNIIQVNVIYTALTSKQSAFQEGT